MVTVYFIFFLVVVGFALGALYYFKQQKLAHFKTETEKTQWAILSLAVPKENEKGPEAAQNMFAALHGILQEKVPEELQPKISFEIVAKSQMISFYVTCPKHLVDFVESQIYAQYPTVEIREVQDYTQFAPKSDFAVAELKTTKEDVLPIKTFPNFDVDPLASLTSTLAKVSGDEQIWVQIIVRPKSDSWQKKAIAWSKSVKTTGQAPGLNLTMGAGIKAAASFGKDLVRAATNPSAETNTAKEIQLSAPMQAAIEGVETKSTKLGYQTKIRLVSFAKDEIGAQSKIHNIIGSFKQFNTTNMNGFALGKYHFNNQEEFEKYTKRFFLHGGFILNIEELASVYHLPNVSVQTPKISWAGSKKGESPKNLPIKGKAEEEDLVIFGKTDFRGAPTEFGILRNDRRHHIYLIGKTGVGKSTTIHNMAISDIKNGQGLAVIDPHGELVESLLDFIPPERIKDVVYFNPADQDYPIAFNLLEKVKPELKSIVASGLVGIFKKIWADSWGPRLEYILRNDILALLDYPGATLLGVTKILVDKDFRQEVIQNIKDPVIKEFWISEYEQYDQRFRTEAIAPIQNKVGQFLSSPLIRNIVGQKESTLDIDDIMNNKKIFLVNLSKGKVGEDASGLLGAMLITKIQIAALERASIKPEERKDFYLYVDEFQNFATESFATILSEARKYRLNILMANQYIAQMDEAVRESVFGNVGTLISFRVGPSDAPYLAKEFMPTFEETDLINLDRFHIYLKMSIQGITCPPFSAETLPPSQDKIGLADQVIEASRKTYAQPLKKAEKEVHEQAQSKIIEAFEDLVQPKKMKVGEKQFLIRKGTSGHSWYFPLNERAGAREEVKNPFRQISARSSRPELGAKAVEPPADSGEAPKKEDRKVLKNLIEEAMKNKAHSDEPSQEEEKKANVPDDNPEQESKTAKPQIQNRGEIEL